MYYIKYADGQRKNNSKRIIFAELYDTAQFEELQKNKKHAAELYEEIIKKYPDSEYAKKAKERLSKLKEEAAGAAK